MNARDSWNFPINPERAAEDYCLRRFLQLRADARELFRITYGDAVREP